MNHNTRLNLTDTGITAAIKLADGNPGAINAMIKIIQESAAIDPQSALAGLGMLLSLDEHGIYGSNIWILFKDVCQEDVRKVCVLLRGVQLDFMVESRLLELCSDEPTTNPLTDDEFKLIDTQVCEFLTDFKRATTPTGE